MTKREEISPKLDWKSILKMPELALPQYKPTLTLGNNRILIFDFLRRKYVVLTPEEWVRQHFIHWLISDLGYPKSLLANEVELQCGEKKLRCDTILYNNRMQPEMIIEYKSPAIELSQKTFEQITSYNVLLQTNWLIMSNGLIHICCHVNRHDNTCQFVEKVPAYCDL